MISESKIASTFVTLEAHPLFVPLFSPSTKGVWGEGLRRHSLPAVHNPTGRTYGEAYQYFVLTAHSLFGYLR
jgi:hypothetical protein